MEEEDTSLLTSRSPRAHGNGLEVYQRRGVQVATAVLAARIGFSLVKAAGT
jgi:hypothetical protein